MTEYKNALVTGGVRRLGRGITRALVKAGWKTIIHYHQGKEEAQTLLSSIDRGQAALLQADLRTVSATQIIEQASQPFGPITCLVNNASIFYRDRLSDLTLSSWTDHLTMNATVPIFLSQAFSRALPSQVKGCIINLLDQKLSRLTADFFSYTVSKSALWTVTQMLAMELAPLVRVNGIAPGLVLPSGGQTLDQFETLHKKNLLQTGVTTTDIEETLLFLIGSPCVTGQMILVNGGNHLTRLYDLE